MTPSHSTDHALPELAGLLRPRLRDDAPVLWRTSSSIQIGDAVTLHDVARSSVAWLTSLDGLRVTDAATMEVVEMVLTGSINNPPLLFLNHDFEYDKPDSVWQKLVTDPRFGKGGAIVRQHA